ncbi:MAG: ShlB/FhaC/HecB family hemolysin secretion/activation protein [Pseudomonadota bacterium]
MWSLIPTALAQTPAQSLQELEAEIREAAPREPSAPAEIPRASITAPPGADEIDLQLQSIALVGRDGTPLAKDDRLPLDDLRGLYSDRLGAPATLADIYEIARDIELSLKRDGFVFIRVLVPRQEIDQENASVQILILGVTVEDVVIEEPGDPVGPVRRLIEKTVAPLKGISNPRIQDLERASLLATDIPGVTRATFVPSQGSTADLLLLSLNVERDPFNAVAVVSHRDSPVIGPGVFGGVGFANSYTSFGASTELAFFNSWSFEDFPDFDERSTVQITQRAFLGTGTAFSIRGLYGRTAPGDTLDALDVTGDQFDLEFAVEHPFLRSRVLSVWGNAGFNLAENSVDVSEALATLTDDSLRVFFAGARASFSDPYGDTIADLTFRKGFEILGASEEGDPDLSRVGAGGSFFLLRGEVAREQPIWREVSAHARVTGQYSPDRLLTNETISLGGSRYLKGYDPSEALGDSGFAAYGELRYTDQLTLKGLDFGYQVYGFGDYGVVFTEDPGSFGTVDLMSTGAGVRVDVPSGPRLELELALPVTDELLRTGDRDVRVFGGMVWFF